MIRIDNEIRFSQSKDAAAAAIAAFAASGTITTLAQSQQEMYEKIDRMRQNSDVQAFKHKSEMEAIAAAGVAQQVSLSLHRVSSLICNFVY